MEKDLIRADADGYGEKCMDCVRGKPFCARKIKKESPNKGTETLQTLHFLYSEQSNHKKRIPE